MKLYIYFHSLFLYFFLKKMDVQTPQNIPSLVYHDFRGMAQTIRYVLFYLNIPFQQILLKRGQTASSLQILKDRNITQNVQLPCFIDGQNVIQDFIGIIRYLCAKAKREDLLGQTLEQRSLIRQILYNLVLNKKKQIKLFFKFGQKAANSPGKREQIRKYAMQHSHTSSQSVIQLTKLKLKNSHQKYIFNHITLLDFLFFEQSFYQVYLFGNLQEKNCSILEAINSIFKTDFYKVKDPSSLYLKIMRQFKDNFEKQPFYADNRAKLQSYHVTCPVMETFTKEAFKKVWLGPEHFLQ